MTAAFKESAEARALQKHIQDVTWDFISRWRHVPGELDIIRGLADAGISVALSKWNDLRGYAQRLPMEVMLRCWSYLEISDLLRAMAVCKAWRDDIKTAPELWTCLDLLAWKFLPRSSLPDLLVRSGNRRLSLRVCAHTLDDLNFLGRCLEEQASRIWLLHIDVAKYGVSGELPFRFGMPELQSLTVSEMHCILPVDFLASNAPLLRSADFHYLQFRAGPPAALEHIASLTAGDIQDLEYRSLPDLTFLEIRYASGIRILPHVPRWSRLRHVVFHDYRGTYAELDDAGYTRLQKLEVFLYDFSTIWEILESWAQVSLHPALETMEGSSVALTIAPHNNSLTFRLHDVTGPELQRLYQRDLLENIVSVAFPPPGDFFVTPYGYGRPTRVLLPQRFLMLPPETLPNLMTHTVYIAPPTSPSLLDLDVMKSCGTLHAPGLKTLVIRRSPCSALAEEVAPVCPSRLALFISKHLEFDEEVLHELVLDGVALEEYDDGGAAVELLESYVRTITVRATESR